MRISEWSSDVCSSDLQRHPAEGGAVCARSRQRKHGNGAEEQRAEQPGGQGWHGRIVGGGGVEQRSAGGRHGGAPRVGSAAWRGDISKAATWGSLGGTEGNEGNEGNDEHAGNEGKEGMERSAERCVGKECVSPWRSW